MATRATEAELLELEQEYWRALKRKDADTIARLTDESCLVTGAQGAARIDPHTIAQMVERGSSTLRDFSMNGKAEVQMLGDDVAVIAYRVHEELTVDGQPLALDAADASTWVRRDGRWVCAQHSESIAGDPYGRDRAGAAAVLGRAVQADALLDRIETAAETLPGPGGKPVQGVTDILRAVEGLRSLLGTAERH
jgi:uncharacterized protein (TIGR02246 family)